MGTWGVVSVVGGVVACILLGALADALGWLVLDEVKEAVFRRRGLAERRGRHRGVLVSGYVVGVCAGLAGFIGVAAATSGVAADRTDAEWLFALAATLAGVAVLLLATWWRLAGRPRHH